MTRPMPNTPNAGSSGCSRRSKVQLTFVPNLVQRGTRRLLSSSLYMPNANTVFPQHLSKLFRMNLVIYFRNVDKIFLKIVGMMPGFLYSVLENDKLAVVK